MKARTKAWSFSTATLLIFVVASFVIARLIGLAGGLRWILWGGLWLLGLIAAALLYRRYRLLARAEIPDTASQEIDDAIAEATRRLSAARPVEGARISRLPVALFLGPPGTTKTTLIANSGLDPELLSGEVYRGDGVAPTPSVNVWYAREAVLVEAGGVLLDDPARWARLVRHLTPQRLGAAVARGPQAPRVAVVCFGCDELAGPGGAEAAVAAARRLRDRLQEVAQWLGIRLPVYVLFTKVDSIPYFADYARGMTDAEVGEVLGATLPLDDAAAGTYGEREAARVREAFGGLFRSLALKRRRQLRRDADPEIRGGVYEFPREFGKVEDAASKFLVELCRPSQLGVSPFLRGFYFAGVRPVVVRDAAAAAPAQPQMTADAGGIGATMVFQAPSVPLAAPSPASGGTRRVPQWVFVRRWFSDVLLGDPTARAVTGGGTRVNFLRRALLGGAAAVAFVLSVGFVTSWHYNRRLALDDAAALQGLGAQGAAPAALTVEGLRALDSLGVRLDRLRAYERDGRPLHLAWGLYRGDALLPALRQAYFASFDRALWASTRAGLLDFLRGLPATATDSSDYSTTYDALKAHLVTTRYPDHSTAAFLTPVLLRYWPAAGSVEGERRDLARRQFDRFASELPFGNPYTAPEQEAVVNRTRDFLRSFAGVDRFYQQMLLAASRGARPVEFAQRFPGSTGFVRDDYSVPAAFTPEGWAYISRNIGDVSHLFAQEDWVTGEELLSPQQLAQMAAELRARYVADYIASWTRYLQHAAVVPFGGAADGATRLTRLSGNQSPLLELISLAAHNTAIDSTLGGELDRETVIGAFQPVHVVIPADVTDRFVVDANKPYMDALGRLQASFDQVAQAGGDRGRAIDQAATDADQARNALRQVTQGFKVDGQASAVGAAVQSFLDAPIVMTDRLLSRLPSSDVNAAGADFCRAFSPISGHYPFSPRAGRDASMDDVAAVLKPGTSVLWTFYQDALQPFLAKQGSEYRARPGARPQPTSAFVRFFNRAAHVSEGLFRSDGSGPAVDFLLRLEASPQLPEVVVSIDGQTQRFTRTFLRSQRFTWDGTRARSAKITGTVGGGEVPLVQVDDGPWALFHLLGRAEWHAIGNGRYSLRWPVPGQQFDLTGEITLASGIPIFDPGYLAGLDCVSTIAR